MGDNIFRFFQHLALRNPQGGFGNCGGKVVDLNAVKLMDGNLNRICIIAHCDLVCLAAERIVFQPPQRNVAFGQEIARAASGV